MNKGKQMTSKEIKKIIANMGYCVKDISIFSEIENIDKESYNPDRYIMVTLCNGKGKMFCASKGKIEEIKMPDINGNELPF